MSHFELIRATPEHTPIIHEIWRRVYGHDFSQDRPVVPEDWQTWFLGYEDGAPGFACQVNHYEIHARGKWHRCAGVSCVATAPEARGTGLTKFALNELSRVCADDGFDCAALYGFRDSYYRKFGYASAGWRWQISSTVDRFPNLRAELPLRAIPHGDFAPLEECYERFIQSFSGSNRRNQAHWLRRFGKRAPDVYAVGDPVEGYFWTNPAGFYNDLEIGEFVWTTGRAYRSLLAGMRSLGINKGKIVWCEPPTSPFLHQFRDHGVDAAWHRSSMFRILKADRTLGDLGLVVRDGICGDSGSGSGEISIAGATQLWLGSVSARTLADLGELTASDDQIAELDRAFPPQDVVCMEFF